MPRLTMAAGLILLSRGDIFNGIDTRPGAATDLGKLELKPK